MRKLTPQFIYDQCSADALEGNFSAATMFVDISGFTPMTERLMNHGKEGAEILSGILNGVFEQVIDAIYARDGYVSGFAGDALTAIFPTGENQGNAASLYAAMDIRRIFENKGRQHTRFGDYELSVKIGLSGGTVNWGIPGPASLKTYYFRGPAIDGCARSEHRCAPMDIVLDEKTVRILQSAGLNLCCETIKEMDDAYYKFISVEEGKTDRQYIADTKKQILADEIISKFVPGAILSPTYKGEFRHIVSVFISFVEPDGYTALNGLVSDVLNKANTYGGFFNSLDFGDKGGTMLVFFGAPVSYEDDVQRAIGFLLWLKRKYKNAIRAGVTNGTAYAGFVGSEKRCVYTCLGNVVNMSARMMMKADFGQVWITEEIKKKTEGKYKTNDLACKELKGVSTPVRVFELTDERAIAQAAPNLYEGEMVSREAEVEKLKGYCQPILDGKFGGVVYVYGEAGVGKSRLVYEMTEKLKTESNARICVLQTDGMLKKGLNPFVYFFNDCFNQCDETAIDKRKDAFEAAYEKLMDEVKSSLQPEETKDTIQELSRIRPIIGAVLGLRWDGSIYENIDPKDRPEVTRFAIKEFFKALSRLGPLVIVLEDMHWLDNESQNVFEIFTRRMEDYPVIILAASRINDDGSKPKLKIDKEIPQQEMTLGNLPVEAAGLFVRNQLSEIHRGGKGKADDNLLSFVFSRTEGNPFYIEQFCLYLQESLLLSFDEGLYKLKKAISDVPVGINAILIARIDRLSSELKELSQIASVLGREFDVQILLEVIKNLDPAASVCLPSSGIKPLLSDGITEKIWNVLSEINYIFKHALLRDAVYEMQLKARLRNLHKIAGKALEKLYPEDKPRYSDIAYHCDKAEQKEKAKDYYTKAGDYAKENYQMYLSIEYYSKSLALCLELFGENHADTATLSNNIGAVYLEKGDYDKALEYFNRSLAIRIDILGVKHPSTAQSYNNIGTGYLYKGENDKALKYYNKALAIRIEILGEKHPDTVQSYNDVGMVYLYKGDNDQALEYHNKSLAIRIEILGEKHSDTAESYHNIGLAYENKGNYDAALEFYNKAFALWIEILGEKHSYTATSYNNKGALYIEKGDYDKALKYLNKGLAIRIDLLGEKHPYTAQSYNNIGMVYLYKGDYYKALEYHTKSLAIRIEILGEKHPDTAESYNNIGFVYLKKGDYDSAPEYLNKALAIAIKILGEKHPLTAMTYTNLGNVYLNNGDYDKSLEYHYKALSIRLEISGEKHPDIAQSYNYIGMLYMQKGDHVKALEYFTKSFAIRSEMLGEKHPDTAQSYNNMGKAYKGKGESGKAMEYYNKALEIYKEMKNEKGTAEVMKNIEDISKEPDQ